MAQRTALGTFQDVVPGAVGSDPRTLEQVALHGNFREQSAMLWLGLRHHTFAMLLNKPLAEPPAIMEERRWRGDPSDGPFQRLDPDALVPPLSAAERAFTSDGSTWLPGERQSVLLIGRRRRGWTMSVI
ncbi:hypothetical protein NKH77_28810 [Streptomyces sp. M19]